jgi:hypothetical protein
VKTMYDFLDGINESILFRTEEMEQVEPAELGLDQRSARHIWVSDECIIVRAGDDRNLQYYGGFEYVDKEYRVAIGDYVIYLADDNRVSDCIEQFSDSEEEEWTPDNADFCDPGSRHHY